MGRRILCFTILLSLALHCSCRIGLLSTIYQQRHEIARFVGLIDSVPVAECGSAYYDQGLRIQAGDKQESIPTAFQTAPEIILFCSNEVILANDASGLSTGQSFTAYQVKSYDTPADRSFQPPRV